MSGSCHWAQSLNDQKDFWHSGQWQRSPGTWGWCTFCRKRHGTSLPSHEGLSAGRSTKSTRRLSSCNIRATLSRIVGEDSKVQRVSASWLQQLFVFFFESQRRHFSRSSAGKDDLVCLRVGFSSIDSRGTLVAGPPPSSSSSRQFRDISNFPGAQGSLSKVDSNTSMIKKVQKEHVPETESDYKTRSNFRALFYRVWRAFGCDQNVHVALVTRGARRSTRNLPYVTITHSYALAFSPLGFFYFFEATFAKIVRSPADINTIRF